MAFYILLPFIYNPVPSQLGSEAAQLRNKDRIKISIRSVNFAPTPTKNITSETGLHRITHIVVRNRTLASSTGAAQKAAANSSEDLNNLPSTRRAWSGCVINCQPFSVSIRSIAYSPTVSRVDSCQWCSASHSKNITRKKKPNPSSVAAATNANI
jgi:hypothetical protein